MTQCEQCGNWYNDNDVEECQFCGGFFCEVCQKDGTTDQDYRDGSLIFYCKKCSDEIKHQNERTQQK